MPISAHLTKNQGGTSRKADHCSLRLGALLALGVVAIASSGGVVASVHAQGVYMAIVPPPPLRELRDPAIGQAKRTQAKQQFVNPERAYDHATGQSLRWDCVAKNWIDTKTDKPVGFQGGKARDGEVVPPPPKRELADSERVTPEGVFAKWTQAKQDPDNPERAYDETRDELLIWDRGQKTWIEAKTGETVGFLGRKGPSSCRPPASAAIQANSATGISPALTRELLFSDHVILDASTGVAAAGLKQSILQMELILTSRLSLIAGGQRFYPMRAERAAVPNAAAQTNACAACAGGAACDSSCTALASSAPPGKTRSATSAALRSALP
jgi:hypothetical protein